MSKLFYRFRTIKSIFTYQELEKQEIYFASLEELNDPMEGFKNLIFQGDIIVWRNLFKHYLLCLECMYQTYLVCGEEFIEYHSDLIPVFRTIEDFETLKYKELFKKIYTESFKIYGLVIDRIAQRSTYISKEELMRYLVPFNTIALEVIQKHYEEEGFIAKKYSGLDMKKFDIESIIQSIDEIEASFVGNDDKKMDMFLKYSEPYYKELNFIQSINYKDTPNKLFLLNFAENYLKAIEKLTYPEVYIASFASEQAVNNASLWGHYGDGHKGVCLIFEADEKLTMPFSSAKSGEINLSFEKIIYEKNYSEIDFFSSFGTVPIPEINSNWYVLDGNVSDIHNKVFNDEDNWRAVYWKKINENKLVKIKDWEYEDEYRICLNSGSDRRIDKDFRLLKYKFKNLKGLIFGLNTIMSDKIKIFDIIKNKCIEYQRDSFEFYQAYYCNFHKNIQFKK